MRKFEFEAAPLEKTYQDYLKMTGKNLNEMELEIRNRDRELVQKAMNQASLKERYMKLKNMDESEVVKENIDKIKTELAKSDLLVDHNREPTLFFRVVKNKPEVYDIIT